MTELPVREMVLYKHGVGYFVRGGETDAAAVALTFREDEINDVLKSLTVIDRAGGQVRGIHYQTPMDAAHRLANTSIKLSQNASLLDLLRDLRGRTVDVRVERTAGSVETVSGRVIGVDYVDAERFSTHDPLESALLSLLTTSGVEVLRLGDLRGVSIQDAQAARDLTYFLDTSTSQDARRTINVRLSEGTHDLMVSYVAPSPTWRVSYRVVAERDENDEAAGKMLLQGWGLFDNRLEEDLDDVRVTLVAGQPISFIYDLYESRIPKRPTVKDESRVAPGPVEYQSASERASFEDFVQAASMESIKKSAMPAAPMRRAAMRMEDAAVAAPPAAEGKATGEFFQYAVTTPVTVKRGESALVPIIGAEVSYERELLYNREKLPKHPTAALRFENTTGLTLERGPVTLVEDGDYVGEAVVPFTKPASEVYLPYAVELGITVTEKVDRAVELHRLNIKDRLLALEEYRVVTVTYTLVSTLEDERTVVVEATKDGGELHETRPPDAETASAHRWKVSVPGRGSVQFTRKTRELTRRVESIKNLEQPQLERFLRENLLSQATYDRLRELLETLASMQRMSEQQSELKAQIGEIHEQQAQLRANMSALNPTGDEAAFRKRIVGQLEGKQDRLDEIHAEQARLQTAIAEAEKRIQAIIEGLGA